MSESGGRTVVVTGAGSGIGRAVALELAAPGTVAHLVGRRAEPLAAVAAEVGGSGGEATIHPTDLLEVDSVLALAAELSARGPVDVLVHAAGAIEAAALSSSTLAQLEVQMGTNLRAPFLLTRELLPALRDAGGQVVFVNSSVVDASGAGVGLYAASKHALRGLADALRAEVNDSGVRVLSVFPGRTATPMQEALYAAAGHAYDAAALLQPGDVARAIADALALPRTAEITDLHIRPFRKS